MEEITMLGASKLVGILVAAQIVLRGLGEVLTRLADNTEAKWDNKVAKVVSSIAYWLGIFLGASKK